jgi:tRNA nucleotidyltransferase/poly(A) polymerase
VAAGQREGWPPDPLFRLESILPPHRARIDALAERLRLSRAETARLLGWADAPEPDPGASDAEVAKSLYRKGSEAVIDRLRHALARELDKENLDAAAKLRHLERYAQSWTKPVLPVTGKDLVAAGITPGPEIGVRLRALEERWIDSGFSLSREALLGR